MKIKTFCAFTVFFIAFALFPASSVPANVSYETYTYNYWGDAVRQPHAYLYRATKDASSLGTSLSFPQDMYVYNGDFFIADTNNSRILKISPDGEILLELLYADGEDDILRRPQGVFVSENGFIYVADTDNSRIVEYTSEGEFARAIGRPDTNLIAATQEYKPTKVVVDETGNMFVIAFGINMGLLEFDSDGIFKGFIGAVKVQVSPFEYMWKTYFSTQEQRDRMQTFIPTEYSSIYLDHENFIYATISNISSDMVSMNEVNVVRRLNPMGKDVLRRLGGNVTGDTYSGFNAYRSVFVDVCATDYGVYFVLDRWGGKVFAYDADGNNLFGFGAKGNKVDTVTNAVALSVNDDQTELYILDSTRGSILVFDITDYGTHLLNAFRATEAGDSEASRYEWQQVLNTNANSELAYIGIGKNLLIDGDYKQAMEYFNLGNSRAYYSKAFYYYRKAWMQDHFGVIMGIVLAITVVVIVIITVRKLRRWVGEVKCVMLKQ